MPGKYTKYRKKLKRFINPDPDHREKVRQMKIEILGEGSDPDNVENINIPNMGAQLADAERAKDHLEEEVKELNIKIEALKQICGDAMESDEVEKITLADGGSVGLTDIVWVSIVDKPKLFGYLKRVYKKDVIEMLTLHHQTLQSLGKAQLTAGKPKLPGTEVFLKTTAQYRNARNGGGNESE